MNQNEKNLTRYTREKTSFLGWRVCISRQGLMFTKYFADGAYENGEIGSKNAALALRDEILDRIKAEPANTKKILEEYQERYAKKKKA